MARAIDIQPIIEEIQSTLELPSYSEHNKGFDDGLEYVLDLIEKAPTLTPPNEPLTLDELREVKDEPAYLKVFDPLLESGWHIIKAVAEDKIIFRGWQTVYVPIDGMGIDYNLYRRPPEG